MWISTSGRAQIQCTRIVQQARDNIAAQTAALWQSHAALGQLVASVMPLAGGIEPIAPILFELARAHPNVWDIAVYDASGRIVFESRQYDSDSLTVSGRAVRSVETAQLDAVPDSGIHPERRLVRTDDWPVQPILVGVATEIGAPGALAHGSVVVLTLGADLPDIGAPFGHNWVLGHDGAVLGQPGDLSYTAVSALIGQGWPALRDLSSPVGIVSTRLPDGRHQLLYRRLEGWPAALVIDRQVAASHLISPFAFAALVLASVALFCGWLARRASLAQAAATAAPGEPTAPRAPTTRQLAASVAHEMNNVLTVLSVDAEMVGVGRVSQSELEVLSTSMMHAAARGAALTHSLLCFAERAILNPEKVDLRARLAVWQVSLASVLDPGQALTCIDTTPAGQVFEVMVDLEALEDGLAKLLRNAAEASGSAAHIGLELQLHDAAGGPMAAIVVNDSGAGMDRSSALAAVEPGFSTKADRQHLGLGLPAVAGFARQSGGTLTLDSKVGLGTRISLFLPLLPDHVVLPTPAPGASPLASLFIPTPVRSQIRTRQAVRVLLVEDNSLVRESIARRLRLDGYHVIEAQSAPDIRAHVTDGIDVLVTDIMLADATDGWTLAAMARSINPGLPLVFTSGFMSSRQPELLVGDELVSFLRKPVNGGELHTVIEGLLALVETRRLPQGRAG